MSVVTKIAYVAVAAVLAWSPVASWGGAASEQSASPIQASKTATSPNMPAAVSPALPSIPERSFDVKKYGAAGDGVQDDTAAIQEALDAAGVAMGGTVVLRAGTFLSGPINLSSNTCLRIDADAVLRMLPFDKYPAPETKKGKSGEKGSAEYPSFINVYKVSNVRIAGPGTIEGQGQPWWEQFDAGQLKAKRPALLRFTRARRVGIRDLKLKDSPMFHIVLGRVTDGTVDGVTIEAPEESPNTDGIDVRGTNIVIENCSISTGDDNVAIAGETSNVAISDCRFGKGHGVSIGSTTAGGVSDVSVNDCRFLGTVAGIKGKSQHGRGGLVQNLAYSNLFMTDVSNPIEFRSYYESKNKTPDLDKAGPVSEKTPMWKNVTFTNITATTPKDREAGILWGAPEAPIENFTFNNVRIESTETFKIFHAKNVVFSSDSSVTATDEEPFALFDAENVQTPDGKVHTVGNELTWIGDRPPGAAPR